MKVVCIKSFIPDSDKLLETELFKMKVAVLKVYKIRKNGRLIMLDDMGSSKLSSFAFITKEELAENFKIIKETK